MMNFLEEEDADSMIGRRSGLPVARSRSLSSSPCGCRLGLAEPFISLCLSVEWPGVHASAQLSNPHFAIFAAYAGLVLYSQVSWASTLGTVKIKSKK